MQPAKFRLTTLAPIVNAALRSARRFPLVLATGIVAAYAGIRLVNLSRYEAEQPYIRLIFSVILGFPLFFALAMFLERRKYSRVTKWLIYALGICVLVGFWDLWPNWSSDLQHIHFIQIAVAFHLLVAFLPYVGFIQPNSFWQYNRALFTRFLTSVFYSAILFAGLSLAFLAVDKLFGVTIEGEAYGRLWFVIAFVFNTWFFISDIPEDLTRLELSTEYPRELRLLTQWILIPIVSIYLLILTIYLAKVLVTWEWPSGWIGYLVSSVATVGILSWLLVYPLEGHEGYGWVRTFARWFYILIMPAIVMLWMAIWKRVEQYGITEERYFLIILSVWFGAVALYYTFSRSRNIKIIPTSLCLLALLTFAGPWGAYTVSRESQIKRLEEVLKKNGLLSPDGTLRTSSKNVSDTTRRNIREHFEYLFKRYGEGVATSLLSEPIRRELAKDTTKGNWQRAESQTRIITSYANIEYIRSWERGTMQLPNSFRYYAKPQLESVNIKGYTYRIILSSLTTKDSAKIVDRFFVKLSGDSTSLVILREETVVLSLPLVQLVDSAAAYKQRRPSWTLPTNVLRAEKSGRDAAILGYFEKLSGVRGSQGPRVTNVDGELFVKVYP